MIETSQFKHVLISRTDNIGDVILTLPLASLLKEKIPGVKVSFMARDHVRTIVEHCSKIDEFYSWDTLSRLDSKDAITHIRSQQFDAVIHVSPNPLAATRMRQAGVPHRIGTSHRWQHWLTCNHRVNFSRARSNHHEAQLNTRLLAPFQWVVDDSLSNLSNRIGLHCDDQMTALAQSFLKEDRFNLIVHPFTHGHAREWPVSHFNALIRLLPADHFNVIVTGSDKGALTIEQRMVAQLPQITNAAGRLSLRELLQLIAHADGLIANSTGPLHMAAGLGIRALGLYPCTPGIDAARWMPLGKNAEVLSAKPNCDAPACRLKNDCICMESITVEAVKAVVMGWLR